jgi:hypothetical protein
MPSLDDDILSIANGNDRPMPSPPLSPSLEGLDDAILDLALTQRTATKAALDAGAQHAPDVAAQGIQAGRSLGLPDAVSLQDPEGVRARARDGIDLNTLADRHPSLAAWLAKPGHAAVGHDDLPSLANLDLALAALRNRTRPEPGKFIIEPGGSVVERLPGGLGTRFPSFEAFAQEMDRRGYWQSYDQEAVKQLIESGWYDAWAGQVGRGIVNSWESTATALRGGPRDPSIRAGIDEKNQAAAAAMPGLGGDLLRGAGGLIGDIPLMLTGAPAAEGANLAMRALRARALAASMLGKTPARYADAAAKIFAARQPTAIREGLNTADQSGTGNGLISYAIESANLVPGGVERALAGMVRPAARGFIPAALTLAKESGLEATDETLTELAHALHEQASGINPDALDPGQLGRRLFVAGALGGLASAGFNAPHVAHVLQAHDDAESLTRARDAIAASKTAKRLPDAVSELIAHAGNDGVRLFQSEAWDELAKDAKVPPGELARLVVGDASAYEQAKATGGDVAVPLDRFLQTFGPTTYFERARDLSRSQVDGVTPAEADAQLGEMKKLLEQDAQAIRPTIGRSENGMAVLEQDPIGAIRDQVSQQLIDTGMAPATARTQATIVGHFFATMAQRTGQDPMALFDRYGLTISRQAPALVRQSLDVVDSLVERLRTGEMPKPDANDPEGVGESALQRSALEEFSRYLSDLGLSPQDDIATIKQRLAEESAKAQVEDQAAAFQQAATVAPRDTSLAPEDLQRQWRKAHGDRTPVRGSQEWLDLVARSALVDAERGVRYEQSAPLPAPQEDPRGSIAFGRGKTAVTLHPKADLSTFLHESGHLFLQVMQDLAGEANASPEIKADWETVRSWLGHQDGALTADQHEQFARGFERYLMEGKAPTPSLRAAFRRFQAWLVAIYKTLRGLNVEMSDDIRRVFDRMLAADAATTTAEHADELGPVFADQSASGMTDAEWAVYQKDIAKASAAANEKVQAKLMSVIERERRDWWSEARAQARSEVAARVNARPDFAALAMLQNGTDPQGGTLPEGVTPFKLDRGAVFTMRGADFLNRLPGPATKTRANPNNRGRSVLTDEGGLHPDAAAAALGFQSGDALLDALANATDRRQTIESETDALLRERHGDPLLDGTLIDEATKAVHTEGRGEVLRRELAAITKLRDIGRKGARAADTGERAQRDAALATIPPLDALRNFARQQVAQIPSRKLNPTGYRVASRREARKSFDAMGAKNYEAAAEAKRRELLSHELYVAAVDAQEQAQTDGDYLKRMVTAPERAKIGKESEELLDAMDSILAQYEFRPQTNKLLEKRQNLAAFIDRLTKAGVDVELSADLVADARRVNWRDLTPEKLREVADSVKHLAFVAKEMNRVRVGEEGMALDELALPLAHKIRTNLTQVDPGTRGLVAAARKAMSNVLPTDAILRMIDGGKSLGHAYRALKQQIDDGMAALYGDRERAAVELVRINSAYAPAEWRDMHRPLSEPLLGGQVKTKAQLLSLALNWGNEGNRQAILNAEVLRQRGIGVPEVEAALARLDERDWNWVQAAWDHIGSYWSRIAEKQRQRTGLRPEQVEATPIATKFGTFKGGYYPLKYDPNQSRRGQVGDPDTTAIGEAERRGAFISAQTRRGHTIERTGSGGRMVNLDLGVIGTHVGQVLYDLNLGDGVRNAMKVLNQKDVQSAFRDQGRNADVLGALEVWLKDVATGEIVPHDPISQMFRSLRVGLSTASMAWSLRTALFQVTSFPQTMVAIGAKHAFRGLMAVHPGRWEGDDSVFRQVQDLSPFMKERARAFSKEMSEAIDKFREPTSRIPRSVSQSYFYLMTKSQMLLDTATWLGAHRKALDERASPADAVRLADRSVAQAQSSGSWQDRANLERGSLSPTARQLELVRSLTIMGSYNIAKFALAAEKTRGLARNFTAANAMQYTVDMSLLFLWESMLTALMLGSSGIFGGDDDKERSLLGFAGSEALKTLVGSIPVIGRASVAAFSGFDGGGPLEGLASKTHRAYEAAMGLAEGKDAIPGTHSLTARLLKSLNDVGGITLKYPSTAINRLINELDDALQGREPSLMDAAMGEHR